MKKDNYKKEALELVEEYLGMVTKDLFSQYYKDKSVEEIFEFLRGVFLEMLGPQKTKGILTTFAKKYHLSLMFEDE